MTLLRLFKILQKKIYKYIKILKCYTVLIHSIIDNSVSLLEKDKKQINPKKNQNKLLKKKNDFVRKHVENI